MTISSTLTPPPWTHLRVLTTALCLALGACASDSGTHTADDASDHADGHIVPDASTLSCPLTPCFAVGEFWIGWDQAGDGTLAVRHANALDRVLWQSTSATPILTSDDSEVSISNSRGSFTVDVQRNSRCEVSQVDALEMAGETVVASGSFTDCELTFTLTFAAQSSRRLRFEVTTTPTDGSAPRNVSTLSWASDPSEAFFGFGAQYNFLDFQGRRLPIWCQEQGHGRGLEPLTDLLNEASPGSGGSWETSYSCVPFYLSTHDYGMMLENNEYLIFDMEADDYTTATVFAPTLTGQILYGDTPMEIVEAHTEYTGRMSPLPDWTQQGAIVRSHGGSQEAYDKVAELQAVDGALAGLWIEDWAGTRNTPFGTRMWWNWVIDRTLYPDFEEMVTNLRTDGVRSLAYFNPFLVDASTKPDVEEVLYLEALDKGYLVHGLDGEPVTIENGGFAAGMIDFTNPDTWAWMKGIMTDLIDAGVSGWMADFGEALPIEIELASGVDPAWYHNQYPYDWARLNREVAEDAGVFDEHLTFNRSGNARSPSVARAFWIGDQLVTWDDFDGFKTVIPAMLSSGLSGYTLQHGEVGGWLSIDYPGLGLSYYRSKELFQRWLETSTFMVLLRLHTTNLPEKNHQYNTDEETLVHFAKMTRVFKALAPYRKTLMDEAASRGLPIVRHLMLHYPDDAAVYALEQQFMLGADFLIAPVVDEGATTVSVYLPAGSWVHLWSGETHGSADAGTTLTIDAPIGEPAVFYRADSTWGPDVRTTLGLTP